MVVNKTVLELAGGAEQNLMVVTPAGGNCFDPDCAVCVRVDSNDAVAECKEDNNNLCKKFIS